jgi:hypothetical protein
MLRFRHPYSGVLIEARVPTEGEFNKALALFPSHSDMPLV